MLVQIIYWNIVYNRDNKELVLQDSCRADMVMLQESWINNKTGAIYNNKKYHIIYDNRRAALYVHKRYALTAWISRTETDWYSVIFREGPEGLIIWSIYSENYIGTD